MPKKNKKINYSFLFGAKPVIWIRKDTPIMALLTPLFTKGVFLMLLPRTRAVFLQLMMHAHENGTPNLKFDPEHLSKKLGFSVAEFNNGVNELSRTRDHILGRMLVEFIGIKNKFILMPWLNSLLLEIENHSKDYYRVAGKFSRLPEKEKAKKRKLGNPLKLNGKNKRLKKSV